jgi:hypothetical protein
MCHDPTMKLARSLIFLSAVVFAVTAIGYLVVPGVMLAVVGVASTGTADFLIRTEGVALLAGAVFLWAARSGPPGLIGIVLVGLGVYYVLGSLVDLAAFAQGLVGTASVPSAALRILLGVLCFVAAGRVTAAGRAGELRRVDGPAADLPPESPETNRTPPAS